LRKLVCFYSLVLLLISPVIYGNNKIEHEYHIIRKHNLGINPISPFISTYNINYGYRMPNKKLELMNSITYFDNISFELLAGFYVIESDLNALNYLISLRKYKNTGFNHRFYGIGLRLLYVKSHDSDVFWFLPLVHDVPGMRIPKSFYIKNLYIGANFETGYTMNILGFIFTVSASASTGIVSENINNSKWKFINKMVFFPSINFTIGWLF